MPSCKVYTLAFLHCFFFVAHNKSQRETHARRRSRDLKRIPCSAAGWQLASPSVMVTPARKLHTWFAFPTSGRETVLKPPDLLFTWFGPLGVFFFTLRTKRFYTVVFTRLAVVPWCWWQQEIPNVRLLLRVPPPHPTPSLTIGNKRQLLWKIMRRLVCLASLAKTPDGAWPAQKNDKAVASVLAHFCGQLWADAGKRKGCGLKFTLWLKWMLVGFFRC